MGTHSIKAGYQPNATAVAGLCPIFYGAKQSRANAFSLICFIDGNCHNIFQRIGIGAFIVASVNVSNDDIFDARNIHLICFLFFAKSYSYPNTVLLRK